MTETLTLEFDGGSRGNPGPAGIGVVIRTPDNTPILTLGRFIGRATSNVAEYTALITVLQEALKFKPKTISIRGDSELIIRQMLGEYRVKSPDLKPLYEEAQHLYHQFDHATIAHNLRHKNELADKLANLAMDRRQDVTDATGFDDPSSLDEPSPPAPKDGDKYLCPKCSCVIRIVRPTNVRPHQLKPFTCQCGTPMELLD